ncbi:LysR substrate-binding domain-containing protein [Micropruina sonneratiae]|uniref:LysR substrate-binding domain-containing protein n=1 Tax=Micropruina sonneratiae TaxID=2986940 RepID=UPI0022266E24|nr:LysR substrate-binding domain-containing protein [Micropruina sp. KQZ13P-5]MCW3158605.1 LysR substrate-binding domain-containing protein [Micropruina sp. KQZ13P-5]
MDLLPDLGSLRLLTNVARLGSIGAAGREAGISQQSASERLRAIEHQVGLVLVQRSSTGSTLTSAGRLLVEWSRLLLQQADEVETALHTLREERSRELHVYASMTTAEYLLPRWLVRLRRGRDTVASLHATNTATVVDAVRRGEADVGFIEGPADLAGLSARVVGHDTLVLVAEPDDPWARRRRPLTPQQLTGRRLTSREKGSGTRQVVEDAFRAAGVGAPASEVELTATAAVLAAVRAGGPPAFVSDRAARVEVESGRLAQVATTGLELRRDFTAVWVGGAHPPAGPVRDLLAIARSLN